MNSLACWSRSMATGSVMEGLGGRPNIDHNSFQGDTMCVATLLKLFLQEEDS